MRDARVTIFAGTPLTISTATTTNGETIDFKSGFTGNEFEGALGYGLGVEVMFTSITSTDNNVVLKWQVSDDASTWIDDQEVYNGELSVTKGSGTKVIVPTRFNGLRRYARLVCTTTGMSGSSFILQAWLSDGTPKGAYGEMYVRV